MRWISSKQKSNAVSLAWETVPNQACSEPVHLLRMWKAGLWRRRPKWFTTRLGRSSASNFTKSSVKFPSTTAPTSSFHSSSRRSSTSWGSSCREKSSSWSRRTWSRGKERHRVNMHLTWATIEQASSARCPYSSRLILLTTNVRGVSGRYEFRRATFLISLCLRAPKFAVK